LIQLNRKSPEIYNAAVVSANVADRLSLPAIKSEHTDVAVRRELVSGESARQPEQPAAPAHPCNPASLRDIIG
jgi:hypothetical protein